MFSEFKFISVVVLILWSFFATKTCSYHADQVKQIRMQTQLQAAEIKRYEAEARTIEAKWAKAESKAYENHAKEIEQLNAMHAERISQLSRVQYTTREIIKYLPDTTGENCKDYATAATNRLSQGADLLIRAERMARLYDAEIERVVAACPAREDPIDPPEQEKDGAKSGI